MKKVILAVTMMLLATATVNAAYTPDANAPRSSIPKEFQWNTGDLFANEKVYESAFKSVDKALGALQSYKGKLTTSDALKRCMEDYMKLSLDFSKVALYSNLKNVEDENNEHFHVLRQKALGLATRFNEKAGFIRDEVLTMKDADYARLVAGDFPSDYKAYLDDLRRRKESILTVEAERVLQLAGDNLWSEVDLNEMPSDVEMAFKAMQRDIELPKIKDEDGKEVQLTFSNYSKYRASKNREVRKETVTKFFETLKKYQNVFAATLGGEFKRDVFLAKARKYPTAVSAYLDRENIDPKVIDNLIASAHKNLKPLHRYIDLRKKLLKLDSVHIYDLYTPIVPSAEAELSYNEASDDIIKALKPLGENYVGVLSKAIKAGSGWVDIYPNKGKESGAFSTAVWGVHPFVKMNFMDSIDDASTLAHEFGHAMHSYLNSKKNPYPLAGYSTLSAEIASTSNEMLFSNYLLNKYKNDDKMRLYLLGERLESIRQTIYRQTLFAEFEKLMHEAVEKGEPLTAELFNKTYLGLVKKYYGPSFTPDTNDDIEWAYIPHFYWKFYVYAYAAGLSSGIAMTDNIVKGGDNAVARYIEFLESPSDVPPLEAIKKAGVDLTKPGIIDAAAKMFDETVTEMEKLAAKM